MLMWVARYDRFIYLILLISLLLFIRRGWRAWQDLQSATFRLEEEHARQRLQQSVWGAFISAGLMMAVFALSALGLAMTAPAAAPQATAPANATPAEGTPQATPTVALNLTQVPSQCDPQHNAITFPEDGTQVEGEIDIRGTARIENFGFYKVEFAPVEQPLFLTIDVGRTPKVDDVLVQGWNTDLLPTGEYWLQLVVVDNAGNPQPPCRVRFRVGPR